MDLLDYVEPYFEVRALGTAIEVGVIGALAADGVGRLSAQRLAQHLSLHPRATALLLGALAKGGFVDAGPAGFALTPRFAGEWRAHEAFIRELCGYARGVYADLERWPELVRTGTLAGGGEVRAFWTYGVDAERAARHGRFLALLTRSQEAALVAAHLFAEDQRVLDVGGNDGELAALLSEHVRGLRAVVFDLPENCARGEERWPALVRDGRVRFVPGNFLRDALPSGCEVAVLKTVLNDWPDKKAQRILEAVRAALPDAGRVLIIEPLSDSGPRGVLFELAFNFLISPATRFRTAAEYDRLLQAAGFLPARATPLGFGTFTVLTADKRA